ncbi:MAG TPA: ABC transporter ATP-binding protein [bacterium]
MIEIESLGLKLGEFTLTDFNLKIKDGEYYVLLGPSGVGKTILLETIAGFHKLRWGRILINGTDVTHMPPEKRDIAFVPQTLGLFPHLTVEENIIFGAKAKHIKVKDALPDAKRLSGIMGISSLMKRFPHELSGGERQRIALARALIIKPKLLLLDEPLSSVDPPVRNQLQYFIKELHGTLGFTSLHVTHDFQEAFLLGDVVSLLLNGKIQQTGKKNEIYFHPRTRDAAEFLGFRNIFQGEVIKADETKLCLMTEGIGNIWIERNFRNSEITVGERVFWGIRPEEIRILRGDTKSEERNNPVSGKIINLFEKAFSHTLIFKIGATDNHFEIEIPHMAYRKLQITTGMAATVELSVERIWVARK